MGLLGVISNKLVMERSDLLKNSAARLIKNKFGRASVLIADRIVWILRHDNDPIIIFYHI